jgi:hypothetical protein
MRRALLLVLGAVAALAVLVGIGRWERGHRADTQNAGMRRVLDAIGDLDGPGLSAYRYLQYFQCLDYRRNGNPFALEVCADAQARVIEAIDRRSGSPKIWSLRDDAKRSTVRIDRAAFDRLLHREGVPWSYLPTRP